MLFEDNTTSDWWDARYIFVWVLEPSGTDRAYVKAGIASGHNGKEVAANEAKVRTHRAVAYVATINESGDDVMTGMLAGEGDLE